MKVINLVNFYIKKLPNLLEIILKNKWSYNN